MLTVLTMLIGFISSLAPDFIKKWQDSSDKKHELEMFKLQMEMQAQGHVDKIEEMGMQGYSDIVTAALADQSKQVEKASQWVIDLSASVRPIVTYIFVIAFIGFKMSAFFAAINPSLPWKEALSYGDAMIAIWGESETALLAGIVAYWFGDRAMVKIRGR